MYLGRERERERLFLPPSLSNKEGHLYHEMAELLPSKEMMSSKTYSRSWRGSSSQTLRWTSVRNKPAEEEDHHNISRNSQAFTLILWEASISTYIRRTTQQQSKWITIVYLEMSEPRPCRPEPKTHGLESYERHTYKCYVYININGVVVLGGDALPHQYDCFMSQGKDTNTWKLGWDPRHKVAQEVIMALPKEPFYEKNLKYIPLCARSGQPENPDSPMGLHGGKHVDKLGHTYAS